jgi:hypothetical protein
MGSHKEIIVMWPRKWRAAMMHKIVTESGTIGLETGPTAK